MNFREFSGWINTLFLISYVASKSAAFECYVCDSEETSDYPCSAFQSYDLKYIKICEEGSHSCRITQRVKDKIIVGRSCETNKINDCKTANGIEYCFCTSNLCNKVSPSDIKEDLDDKEEESKENIEGSGGKITELTTFPAITNTKTSTEKPRVIILDQPHKSKNTSKECIHSSGSHIGKNLCFTFIFLVLFMI